MSRRWHVEHADGRPWTRDELSPDVEHVCIEEGDVVWLLLNDGWCIAADMVVVWDD